MDVFLWGVLLAGRIFPVVLLLPAFGGKRLPLPAKIALVAVIVMILHPHSLPGGSAPAPLRFIGLLLKELAVGTVLALSASCLFEGLRMGGQLVDNLRGSASALAPDPMGESRTSPLATFHVLLATVAFFSAGGPTLFLQALGHSLERLPLDACPPGSQAETAAELMLAVTGEAIRTGVCIAVPAATALLLADVALGFINRAAPAIQVFFLGMPLRVILGLVAVLLTLDRTLERFLQVLLVWQ